MSQPRLRWSATTWIALVAAALGAAAQSVASPLAFDVASLRQDTAGGTTEAEATRDGYRATDVPILRLVVTAYAPTEASVPYFEYTRVLGVPDWVKSDGYSLDAKVAESDLAAWQQPDSQKTMLRAMLQTLLADRCKLAAHREMKELTLFSLVPTKRGAQLKETPPADLADLKVKHPGGVTLPDGGILINGDGRMSFFGVSMAAFSQMLSVPAGHPVEDKTGLPGRYDFVLRLRDQGPAGASPSVDPALSIFTVMQEQLGLRLQSEKGQVEMLVIDHIERPSEN